jgi:BirA family biotin operon repressor/biotin-[acetyl-CoA-carboxylase] ligase
MSDWQIFKYTELDSTNNKALKLADVGRQKIVIQAEQQTAGRGRRGRSWSSLAGNLFFSQVFAFDMQNIGALVIICSLSVLQTIKDFFPQADVSLKWPNDVLLNGAKVSGILLEKGPENYMIIGIGVNVAQSPDNAAMLYPTTSLREAGIKTDATAFLQQFLLVFSTNLETLAKSGTEPIRQTWLSHAAGLNRPIIVKRENSEQHGIFQGLDSDGRLLLQHNNQITAVSVGDVFFNKEEKDE